MNEQTLTKNWAISSSESVFDQIHQNDVNITIYNREVSDFAEEINCVLKEELNLRFSGDLESIENALIKELGSFNVQRLVNDVSILVKNFAQVTGAESFNLFLGTINTNMCRKFHTDINDLRLLCTYSGPGTLWLKEENINRTALKSYASQEDDIVISQDEIQQVETGSVVLLKGAIYPKQGTKAAVHRSPTIEESGERRLLLRIDTNEFLNY